MKKDKKTLILGAIIVLIVLFLVLGGSYAFFEAQNDNGKSVDVNVSASTVDEFKFSNGDAMNLSASRDNFATGDSSLTSATSATASLTANNNTNATTEHYYLYLNIESNTFTYSIDTSVPELLLTITGPDGEVKKLDSLNYVTVEDSKGKSISGFNITKADGLITIANNKEIIAGSANGKSSKVDEEWTFTLTFVNYTNDQSNNEEASLTAKVMIQKEKIINLVSDVCSNGDNLSDCIINSSSVSSSDVTRIYHHDGSLTNGINDGSYRYAGGSKGTKNYVCFGSIEEKCSEDNLYRIIGVFDGQVKLIKASRAKNTLLGTDGDKANMNGDYTSDYIEEIYNWNYYWNYMTDTLANSG